MLPILSLMHPLISLAAAMTQAPGEQVLLERLGRIEALPPSERPYDAACFLEAHRLQKEVAAALPLAGELEVVVRRHG